MYLPDCCRKSRRILKLTPISSFRNYRISKELSITFPLSQFQRRSSYLMWMSSLSNYFWIGGMLRSWGFTIWKTACFFQAGIELYEHMTRLGTESQLRFILDYIMKVATRNKISPSIQIGQKLQTESKPLSTVGSFGESMCGMGLIWSLRKLASRVCRHVDSSLRCS